ncbi:hypothetical protein DDY07_05375 [Methylomonas sp. ZR1]|nr:hypothetical protein [Methylomonas sp. ZR1]
MSACTIEQINKLIADAETTAITIPSEYLDDEHMLANGIALDDESTDARWWHAIEGSGDNIGVFSDQKNQYWVLIYTGGELVLTFSGDVDGVADILDIEIAEEND